ncbi:MFS transporter [Rhodopila sp.]|jgi:MFS family permease|uniref:MFS transporter n=1 Tax=Rhodopila sp. TaxID=2480087 RepID=UPI002C5B662D|nr:MFS transporter [Rhodopila sp.]HVZ07525.1 MFS transporter [Rhodopila sp.]
MQNTKLSATTRTMQILALTMLIGSAVINYLDRAALSIANVEVREEMGLNATQMGVLLSAFLLSYAFAQLPAGVSVDRIGPRILLGVGLGIWSLAQLLAGFVTSFTQFYWARIALGLGESPQFPTAARVVGNWFHISRRGVPMAAATSVGPSLGTALAPPILTALMLAFGWRMMFITMGVIGLVGALVWFLFYRDPEQHAPPQDVAYIRSGDTASTSKVTLAQWGRLFRCRTTWAMLLGNFGSGYLFWVYYAWLPGFLEMQHHVSVAKTGIYASIPPLCGIVGALAGGWVSDRLAAMGVTPVNSRKIPIIVGLAGTAALTVCAAYANSAALAITLVSIAVLFSNCASATIWGLVTVAAPPNYVASLGSIQNCGGYLGGAASPVVTGMVVDMTGSFEGALFIGAAVAALGALIYLFGVVNPISGSELEYDGDGLKREAV